MQIGLWIDHRKAVVVKLSDDRERVEILESNMEKHIRPSGGSRSKSPYGPQDVMKEDTRERKFRLHLSRWYDVVAEAVQYADELLVFGPGEGKNEFRKHIAGSPLAGRIVGLETVDRMTTPQIAAMVRKHFIQPEYPVAM
ncbi:MAG: hypothetical protein AB3N33_11985 [Puniceicoccaceae bacterium]